MKIQLNRANINVNLTDDRRIDRNRLTAKGTDRKKYAAYGSNIEIFQMEKRCPTARIVGKGVVPGHELLFRGYPEHAVATIEPKKGENVPVLIWEIGAVDEDHLDIYEGYPQLYGKQEVTVQTDSGAEQIMVYTMNQGQAIGRPCREYLSVITRGYLQAGFDVNYLKQSVEKCTTMMNQTGPAQKRRYGQNERPDWNEQSKMTEQSELTEQAEPMEQSEMSEQTNQEDAPWQAQQLL